MVATNRADHPASPGCHTATCEDQHLTLVKHGFPAIPVGQNSLKRISGRVTRISRQDSLARLFLIPGSLIVFNETGQHGDRSGYRVRFQIVDWPDGMPRDIGITLSWGGSRDFSGYGAVAASRQLASRCGANGLVK